MSPCVNHRYVTDFTDVLKMTKDLLACCSAAIVAHNKYDANSVCYSTLTVL